MPPQLSLDVRAVDKRRKETYLAQFSTLRSGTRRNSRSLLVTTVSGILVHVFRLAGMPLPTYYMYVFHLMVLFPMLMIEVPFSKWSHLAYRPFAVYFDHLKKSALALQKKA